MCSLFGGMGYLRKCGMSKEGRNVLNHKTVLDRQNKNMSGRKTKYCSRYSYVYKDVNTK
jgi:hypothetical protein